jgi:hypothetical protein
MSKAESLEYKRAEQTPDISGVVLPKVTPLPSSEFFFDVKSFLFRK